MKKAGLKCYVYDFSVNYNAIVVSNILDIHRYLRKNNEIVLKCSDLRSEYLFQQ